MCKKILLRTGMVCFLCQVLALGAFAQSEQKEAEAESGKPARPEKEEAAPAKGNKKQAESDRDQAKKKPEQPIEGEEWTVPELGMEFVWIDPLNCWVGKYEVTNGEYRKKVPDYNANEHGGKGFNGDRQPVVGVSFTSARMYAKWLTERERKAGRLPEGFRYRLPTTEEWTTFAECGDDRKYPWGDNWPPETGEAGNYEGEEINDYKDGHKNTCNVEESWKNAWGLYGVGGNVWECTAKKPGGGLAAWRGAAWDCGSKFALRCSMRISYPAHRMGNYGFRLVLAKQ